MKDDVLKRFRDQVPDPVNGELIPELEPPALPGIGPTQARGRFSRIAVGVVAAGALAIAAFAVLASGGGDNAAGPLLPIPKPLATASAAAAQADPTGIQYTRTTGLTLALSGNYSFYMPRVYEAWLRPDGSGRLRITQSPYQWPGPRDRARAVATNDSVARAALGGAEQPPKVRQDDMVSADQFDESWDGGSLPPSQDLSSDPSELRSQLESFGSGAGPVDVRLFEHAAAVLLDPAVDGSVRAAAFEVIGQLQGVTIDRSATDPTGRTCTSASITSAYTGASSTRTVYFDPDSSKTFAFTDVLDGPENFIDSRTLTTFVVTDDKTVSSVPPARGRPN